MPDDNAVAEHYSHGNLLNAIHDSLSKLGKTKDDVTIEDLAPVDEFHIGGRQATESFLAQLNFSQQGNILDVGCGLGGTARYVASTYNTKVTGIDLTAEYIETGNALCSWVNLDKQITLQQGSALSLPFDDESFDGAYMMHVAMNIDDKAQLFNEVFRVLRSGSIFGVYDVMQVSEGDITYPVPWATEQSTSYVTTPEDYKAMLSNAGFKVAAENNRCEFALEFFKRLRERTEAGGGPPPLGLHTLMQESTTIKITNMISNIKEGYIAPIEIVATK